MPCRYLYFVACLPDLQLGSLHYVNLTGRRIKKFFKRSDDEFIFYDPVRFTSWFPSHLPKSWVARGLVLKDFAVIVAMQIRARVLLEQTEAINCISVMLPLTWGRPCWFEQLPPKVIQ